MAVVLPDWLDTALDIVGVAWPNVDEDAYRDMAVSLREFADDIDDDGHAAHLQIQRLLSSGSGEAAEALARHWGKARGKQGDIAEAARLIAGALDTSAGVIEGMKYACIGHLSAMIASAGISLAAAPLTFGLSTLISAGTVTATRTLVKKLIKEAGEEAVNYIMSALTEPAVQAIENVAADLAVQAAANVVGLKNGIDTGQAVQAGKDGFQDGITGAKEGLHLASVDGGPPPGSMGRLIGDLNVDHDEHGRVSGKLHEVSGNVGGRTKAKLSTARSHHGRTRGRDSIAQVIDPIADRALNTLSKATKDFGDHLGTGISQGVKKSSDVQRNTDLDIRDRIKQISSGDDKDDQPGNGGRSGRDGPRHGEDGTRSRPEPLSDAKGDPRRHSVSLGTKTCKNDPVDVATGEMLLPQTDLELPGVLPLVLRRTHLSGYRFGHWFGRSWASLLDERVELDPLARSAMWARQDGSVLVYPRLPAVGDLEGVLPVEGPRLPLVHERQVNGETTYRISDPTHGWSRFFTGSPYRESSAFWLSEMQDRNGNGVTITRLGDGSPVLLAHDGGYRITVSVRDGRVERLALRTPSSEETIRRYGYDPDGNLDAVVNSSGLPLRFTYDSEGRITSWTDRNDSTFQYVYDQAGRVVRTVGPDGILSSSFAYGDPEADTGLRSTRYTNSHGATTVFRVDDRLRIVAETDPLGHTTHSEYDIEDQQVAVTDPLGRTTHFERDERGNLVGMTAPDGARTRAVFNHLNLPVEIVERGGVTHYFEYDVRGNLTATVGPDGRRTEYELGARGQVTAVRTDAGVSRLEPDAAGLMVSITAPDGTTARCVRDAFGRITEITDAAGGILREGWTTEGRPAWRQLPDGSREEWVWDGEGNLVRYTDRMGGVTTSTTTHFDRVSTRVTPDGSVYRFTYDTELRLTEVVNAQGLTWTYTYDEAGRLVRETDFDDRTMRYEWDAAGQLIRRANAVGQTLTYERDVLGRVLRVVHDDGTSSTFVHDEHGRLARTENTHAHITFERDAAGRVVAETVNGRTLTLAYDHLGRRVHRRTPSGATTDLVWEGRHLAACTTGDHTFRFERDALGRETTCLLDGTLALRNTFDAVGRTTNQHLTASETTLLRRGYTYRPDGTPIGVNDTLLGNRRLTVDPVGRITGVQADGWQEEYGYNAAGDQTNATFPAGAPGQETSGSRDLTGTRVTRAGRTRYDYDAQGRMIRRRTTTLSGRISTWHFTWNAEDRLTEACTPDGSVWQYHYDPLGRRLRKQRLGSDGHVLESVDYSWDGAQVAEQRSGGITMVWDYDGMRPLSQREARTDPDQQEVDRRFFAIVSDLTGSPSCMVAPDGTVAWRARATAWGATQWNSDATAYTPLRYPGQYFDLETGLHYNVNRYYDPQTARYISPDPLGLAAAFNHYAYVPNPCTMADPLGLAGCERDHTWGGKVRFVQDEHSRPYEMHATITRDMLDEGTSANPNLQPPGFLHGTDYNQARGHMLARMLGGTGDHLDNLFTITQNPTNSPHMRDLEQSIYNAVYGDPANNVAGEIVQYSVYLDYTDDRSDSVPSRIFMQADGSNGFHMDTDFVNPDHAAQQHRRRLGIQ